VGLAKDGMEKQAHVAGVCPNLAGLITNLAALITLLMVDNAANRDAVRDADGIPVLADYLAAALTGNLNHTPTQDWNGNSQKYALFALRTLAVDNPTIRDAVRDLGAIPMLVKLARDGTHREKKCVAKVLGNLMVDNPANRDAVRESGAIPVLARMLTWARGVRGTVSYEEKRAAGAGLAAAVALRFLTVDSPAHTDVMIRELVGMVRDGTRPGCLPTCLSTMRRMGIRCVIRVRSLC
jgi:hypothetical protein